MKNNPRHRKAPPTELEYEHDDANENKCAPQVIIKNLLPIVPTEVYNTYWYFAAERQEIFFRKLHNDPPPWTNDRILMRHKFTNAYRASDRVSQYLIRRVIYSGEQTPIELFFRVILFKIFNKIQTWEILVKTLGQVEYRAYSFERYDKILTETLLQGQRIFSAAYIMPSGKSTFGSPRKHQNCLMLLEKMINENVPWQITELKSMRQCFELLRSYPLIGDFLAYQYAIDLNYSTLTNFSEMEFVVPGPGSRDGIRKCFNNFGGLNEADIIRVMAERQDKEFERLGIKFKTLFGRPLQLIDCQNLFCEVDKYSRVAHPDILGRSGRTRIKQVYSPTSGNINYWYPPKWDINDQVVKKEQK